MMKIFRCSNNFAELQTREQRCQPLSALAAQALIAEAELTPKPGLVDGRGSGAHTDLSLELMKRSARALEPYFVAMSIASRYGFLDRHLREELALIGRTAELAMLESTKGSNSHKGAIWTLGLLVASATRSDSQDARKIAADAGKIARFPDRAKPRDITHGDAVRRLYGVSGARGEALAGFPTVLRFGLPTLRQRRAAGFREEVCRLDTLLSIMSRLNDTCLLYRGGIEGLTTTKAGARAALLAGGYGSSRGRTQMHRLEVEVNARGISPGGSADLLAATIFLDAVERQQHEVRNAQSE